MLSTSTPFAFINFPGCMYKHVYQGKLHACCASLVFMAMHGAWLIVPTKQIQLAVPGGKSAALKIQNAHQWPPHAMCLQCTVPVPCVSGSVCMQASNLKAAYMHLTNYAVNKHNENFVSGAAEDSSKWDFGMLRY